MMLRPSVMKSREVQVMLGTVMRSSSLGLSTCHTLMSSSEHVANNSDVPLVEDQIKELSLLRLMCSLCYHTHTHTHSQQSKCIPPSSEKNEALLPCLKFQRFNRRSNPGASYLIERAHLLLSRKKLIHLINWQKVPQTLELRCDILIAGGRWLCVCYGRMEWVTLHLY